MYKSDSAFAQLDKKHLFLDSISVAIPRLWRGAGGDTPQITVARAAVRRCATEFAQLKAEQHDNNNNASFAFMSQFEVAQAANDANPFRNRINMFDVRSEPRTIHPVRGENLLVQTALV